MKAKWLIVATLMTATLGCGTVHFDVPQGQRVKLLTQDDPVTQRIEKKIWYVGWGAKPLTDNHTAKYIAKNKLTEVRMYTRQDFWDNLISAVTGVLTFSRRTLIIEGNTGPAAKEATK